MPGKVRADDGLGFDNVPAIYDRIRPTYPSALFDELFAYLGRDGEWRAVEIGPGTGQATRPLLEHGFSVVAVEPGEQLAALLSRKLGVEFPQLDVIVGKFEDVELESGAYDLVLAATAFHWIDAGSRFQRCHNLLSTGATLAIVYTNQIDSDADRGFFARAQPVYNRYQPNDALPKLSKEDELTPPEHDGFVASGLFDDIQLHRYRWDQTYASADYGDLMRSYSVTQAMGLPKQEDLVRDVCALIDTEFDGFVTRPLVMTLTLGRRTASS